jgi:protein-tyrosine-phosphatase/DNA-binding HxlR family transcriptional regulator
LTQLPLIHTVAAVDGRIEQRAAVHAALGEPVRLAIVEELATSDRTPSMLAARFGLAGNLLAHHLDVLERVGLVERHVSAGDRRRRYVRLRRHALGDLAAGTARRRGGRALFVCTQNSARSQLAAALWRERTGHDATSAGTHPAARVHPGAVAAARRAGLDLTGARPRALDTAHLDTGRLDSDVVVTVCDRAHEELDPPQDWLHWSVPDPVGAGTRQAFDAALADLDQRITAIAGRAPDRSPEADTGPAPAGSTRSPGPRA